MELEGLALRVSPTNTRVKSQLPSIYGFGDIDLDKTYNVVMNKWKWGNFDKQHLFVDRSYMAELQDVYKRQDLYLERTNKINQLGLVPVLGYRFEF